jgi:hypothetical protein
VRKGRAKGAGPKTRDAAIVARPAHAAAEVQAPETGRGGLTPPATLRTLERPSGGASAGLHEKSVCS